MEEIYKNIIDIAKSAITGEAAVLQPDADYKKIILIAKYHNILPIVFYGLKNSKIETPYDEYLFEETAKSVIIEQKQSCEAEKIHQVFSKNGIDHAFLKGLRMRLLYPNSEMRALADLDIFIKTEQFEKVQAAMADLGYEYVRDADYVYLYHKKPYICLELHKALVPSRDSDYYDYFKNAWSGLLPVKNSPHVYEESIEDFYIFAIAHLAKHYRDGGIGIKHLIDIWVMRNKWSNINHEYVNNNLKILKLYDFHNNLLATVNNWFSNAPSTPMTEFLTKRFFKSGAYGEFERVHASHAVRVGKIYGKHKNNIFLKIIQTIFLPLSSMKNVYPVLKKAPVLLPVMWVARWFKTVFVTPKHIVSEIKRIKSSTNAVAQQYSKELEYVGLSFDL